MKDEPRGEGQTDEREGAQGDDWTAEERERLDRLPREKEPPPELEERVVAELLRRGRLAPAAGEPSASRRWIRPLLQMAAAVVLLLVGAWLGETLSGRGSGPATGGAGEHGPRFLLLLYDPPDWTKEEEPQRAVEYASWARGLAEEGRSVTGAPLGEASRVLAPADGAHGETETSELGPEAGSGPLKLGGYFLIGAADFERAVEVAESCPHLRHGGTVVVRPLSGEP